MLRNELALCLVEEMFCRSEGKDGNQKKFSTDSNPNPNIAVWGQAQVQTAQTLEKRLS
jgi:hypothetical protein